MPHKPQSLRRQLLLWLLAMLIPLLLFGAVNSYFRAYHFSDLAYDRALFRAALALADQVLVVQGRVVVDLPQSALDLLEYDKDDWVYYRVSDPQGRTVTGEESLPLPATLPQSGGHLFYETTLGDRKLRAVVFALPLVGTSASGDALVQVAETESKRAVLANEILGAIMLPQVLIAILAGIMVSYSVRRGLAPLERLRQAIEQRSHRDLTTIPVEDTPREVTPMLRAMNDLLLRLQDSIERQQRFTADASHQLRTPLAGIQTQAELALRETDPERLRESLEWIRSGTQRLSHLVSQLLALARVEPGSGREMQFETLDLIALTRDVTGEWVSVAIARHIDLGFQASLPGLPVRGHRVMLREMLSNLLDNALRYTPAPGRVTVSIEADLHTARLVVEDSGPGIPEGECDRVFERFHRVPDAAGDGCGLGLAIVREIVEAHGAEITVTQGSHGVGARFVISIPVDVPA